MKKLTKNDIVKSVHSIIKIQDYSPKKRIGGVQIIELKNFISEDGLLCEVTRFKKDGYSEVIKNFQVLQVSYSETAPGAIKAWHLHFSQEDLWFIPPNQKILVGLYDLRKDSSTLKTTMRFSLGGGRSQLLYIPRGVAHGCANLTQESAAIVYFVNQKFNLSSPDERRFPWDMLGKDFWQMSKG